MPPDFNSVIPPRSWDDFFLDAFFIDLNQIAFDKLGM